MQRDNPATATINVLVVTGTAARVSSIECHVKIKCILTALTNPDINTRPLTGDDVCVAIYFTDYRISAHVLHK